jgi:biopolymer transport protein ExbB
MNIIYLLKLQAQTTETDSLLMDMLQDDSSVSFLEILSQGGLLMIPLFILSVITIYVIAERWRSLENSKMDINNTLNTIETLLKSGSQQRAIQYCEEFDKPLARILKAGIRKLGRPIVDIQDSIKKAGKKEIFQLEKRMNWLATISGVAPLIGFTGTVTGMIRAFMDIQSLQGNVNPSVLAGGIWEALITTAAGLIVGIIAFGFYNYLLGKINRLIFELENASADFMDLLQAPAPKKRQED